MTIFVLVVLLACLYAVFGTEYPTPAPTFEAKQFTNWHVRQVNKSRRADIKVDFKAADGSDDQIHLFRVDLVGNPYERGYGHGFLLAKEIVEFLGPKMNAYYRKAIIELDLSQYPEPLRKILEVVKIKGVIAAPEIVKKAMLWVWDKEVSYFPSYFIEEIDGIANGMCAALGEKHCNVDEWRTNIQAFNMMPELIRMACTAYGAWGKSTPSGKGLIQLRALDFGGGPYSNYTVLNVHHDEAQPDNAFVSIAFPGMVGAITGVSQSGVGISEKVWMITTDDPNNMQPGSFQGIADVFVLRHVLQHTKSKADAEAYVQSIPRTWGIWMGVGDYETMSFDLIGYQQKSAEVFTDVTMPSMTGQPYLPQVAYVDKHPQPTRDGPNGSLPTALTDFYGNITCETSKIVTQFHQTGDVHIASYDFENKYMYVAIGRVDHEGDYVPNGKAYNRPYVKFNLRDLWAGR